MNTVLLAFELAVAYLAVIVLTELLRRKYRVSADATRRAMHIFSGFYTIWIFQILPATEYLTLVLISLVVVVLSKQFNLLTSIHEVKRKTFGEIFLPLGTLSTYFITQANPDIFIPSILVLTLADSFAGIVSDCYKTTKQSWQGSLVFFATASMVLLVTSATATLLIAPIALVITLVERYSPLGTDNITVPVSATVLILLF
ncbi:MAG: hypothetical protein ACKOFA_03770 [Rhodoluna sp.]